MLQCVNSRESFFFLVCPYVIIEDSNLNHSWKFTYKEMERKNRWVVKVCLAWNMRKIWGIPNICLVSTIAEDRLHNFTSFSKKANELCVREKVNYTSRSKFLNSGTIYVLVWIMLCCRGFSCALQDT